MTNLLKRELTENLPVLSHKFKKKNQVLAIETNSIVKIDGDVILVDPQQ